jgi:hypothetical protein
MKVKILLISMLLFMACSHNVPIIVPIPRPVMPAELTEPVIALSLLPGATYGDLVEAFKDALTIIEKMNLRLKAIAAWELALP